MSRLAIRMALSAPDNEGCAGATRRSVVRIGAAAAMAFVFSIAACSSRSVPPDPAQLEQQIADARVEELDLARATITDQERASQYIELLTERDQLLDRLVDDVSQHRDAMARLDADYYAERSEFEALLADYNQKRAAAQRSLVDLVSKMKQTTTDDEWRVMSRFQADRLDIRQMAYRGLQREVTK